MRSIWRTRRDPAGHQGAADGLGSNIALICLADALVGVSFGAISVGNGFGIWVPVVLSLVVFAGASQFLFVALAMGNPIAAVLAGLLINVRHFPFGLAVGDVIGSGLTRRVIGSHVLTDESTAFALAQTDPALRRRAFWGSGVGIFVCWNIGVLAGAFGGSYVPDTDMLGLDAAFPAVLLAILLPSLRQAATRIAAVVGGLIALATALVLPAGLPVLLSLAALPLALRTRPERAHG